MEGSPLRTSDFILVVWFTPQPRGTHFRLPHHTWLIYTELVKLTQTLNLPYIHFPQLYFNVLTPIPWRGLPWAWRILFSSSGSLQNRVVLISVYPITWLINTELLEFHWTLNSLALHFPQTSLKNIYTPPSEVSPLGLPDFILVVWLTSKPCGTHFRSPHNLALNTKLGKAPLNFELYDHPFPTISPRNINTHSRDGSPLNTSDFMPVVWFTSKPCGTHFRLPFHLAHRHWTGRAPLKFEPSGPSFPPTSPQKKLHPSHGGFTPEHDRFHPRCLVYPITVWYSFPYTPSLGLYTLSW